ncbi:hypothetical protein [Candidatus Paracaedibacter symbiosus]|uniref:hypothetical protein n=1 Tax=Candidatus Paracaedibacter symbiosus TaxID=244582 RepID=UPI0012EB3BAD|nr:hypothetical protein [Candidatus Paracaedibacter symbiosus]
MPAYTPSEPEEWLKEMKGWLEEEIEQNKNNKLKIKEELNSLKNLYHALNDLNDYEETLGELSALSEELNEVIKKISS